MSQPSPHWYEADWDQLRLGATILPGVWRIEGSAERRIEVKPRKGQDGAVIKDQGYENARLTLVGQLVHKAEYDALQVALKDIHPRRKGAERDALLIVHPVTTLLGVDSVYITALNAVEIDNGILTQRIEVIEFVPQPKARPKKKLAAAANTRFGDAAQRAANASVLSGQIYTSESGVDHVNIGFARPSADVDWAASSPTSSDLALQPGF